MNSTYLTIDELSERIKYDARTIRNQLKDSVLLEGVHYIRPLGIMVYRDQSKRSIVTDDYGLS